MSYFWIGVAILAVVFMGFVWCLLSAGAEADYRHHEEHRFD